MRIRRHYSWGLAAFVAVGMPNTVRGDLIDDLAFSLGYAGFDLRGTNNVLSGGVDFLLTNTFVGNELDFGPADLTLQGPLSLSVSAGGRELSELEFSLRTASDATEATAPLNYVLNYDVGGQVTQISGNLLMDANLKLNGFGYYDLDVQYSSRQTVSNDGRFANGSTNHDFDLGPIHVRGNIYADALALITEPLFAAAGQTNPFASFSGQEQLKNIIDARAQAAVEALAAGFDSPDFDTAPLANAAVLDQVLAGAISQLLPTLTDAEVGSAASTRAVPEPTVLLLMLLGIPMLFRRGFFRFPATKRPA